MSDAKLIWNGTGADIALDTSGDLVRDDGLRTAIIISLLTDRRADDDDIIPDGSNNRRGFFLNPTLGSKLWLLSREKNLPVVINRARQYVREALAWLTDLRIAQKLDITVESVNQETLGIQIQIHRPQGDEVDFRFDYLWQAEALAA